MDIKDFLLGYAAGQGQGGSDPVLEPVTVTPSTSQQVITPPEGADGISQATVSAVTKELLAQLDADFTAGNIKQGVDILGLLGTYTAVQNMKIFEWTPLEDTINGIIVDYDQFIYDHAQDDTFMLLIYPKTQIKQAQRSCQVFWASGNHIFQNSSSYYDVLMGAFIYRSTSSSPNAAVSYYPLGSTERYARVISPATGEDKGKILCNQDAYPFLAGYTYYVIAYYLPQ